MRLWNANPSLDKGSVNLEDDCFITALTFLTYIFFVFKLTMAIKEDAANKLHSCLYHVFKLRYRISYEGIKECHYCASGKKFTNLYLNKTSHTHHRSCLCFKNMFNFLGFELYVSTLLLARITHGGELCKMIRGSLGYDQFNRLKVWQLLKSNLCITSKWEKLTD